MVFQDIKTLSNKNEMCECKNFENNAIVLMIIIENNIEEEA